MTAPVYRCLRHGYHDGETCPVCDDEACDRLIHIHLEGGMIHAGTSGGHPGGDLPALTQRLDK